MLMRRVGLIVPSSNVTMETEIPQLLGRRADASEEKWSFHSSRARLHTVDAKSLACMLDDGNRCAAELGDADVDVVAYACLVAVMTAGAGAHKETETRLGKVVSNGRSEPVPVVSSAGALVRTLQNLDLRRVAIVAPYKPALTQLVIEYMEGSGITVIDSISLSVTDNRMVGRLDPVALSDHVSKLRLQSAQAIVLSACVQMPSLPMVQPVQDMTGLPVLTAATSTTREILLALGLEASVPNAGVALGLLP